MSPYLEPSHIFYNVNWPQGTDYFKKLSENIVRYKIPGSLEEGRFYDQCDHLERASGTVGARF